MAVKLALDDKQNILRLYRDSGATTTQLAKQFGISTSTVVRLLQELMPVEEYRQLVTKKKADGKKGARSNFDIGNFQVSQLALITEDLSDDSDDISVNGDDDEMLEEIENLAGVNLDVNLDINLRDLSIDKDGLNGNVHKQMDEQMDEQIHPLIEEEIDEEDLGDEDDEDDLVDEDNLDLELDELDFAEDEGDTSLAMFAELQGHHSAGDRLEILPLDEAELPIICYIVVDRIAEIITRPLKDFKDLGAIPLEENQSKTIPIFDNHRVAKRFSHSNQRVIKFPSDLIHITRNQLIRKGITRILFSGQVYALN